MKLSVYKGEEAIDVLADMLEPASKIMTDKAVKAAFNAKLPPLMVAKTALKSQKKAVVELISALHREQPGEYEFTMLTLISDLLDILNDEEFASLFTSADTVPSSGSATETIEEDES